MTEEKYLASNGLATAWGVLGVVALLLFALMRLTPIAFEALAMDLNVLQWLVLLINTVFMAYSEGYKGFQLSFSPRVAARALYLYRNPVSIGTQLLAPFFVFGYFHASRRGLLVAWIGTAGIVALVLLVHQLDQPWRGVIDAGVVVGLTWGLISYIASVISAFTNPRFDRSPELT